MKKLIAVIAILMLLLCGCAKAPAPETDTNTPPAEAVDTHTHTATSDGENLIDDPQYPTCGNTPAKVTRIADGQSFEFMGGDGVYLNGLLENLKYDPAAVCKCDNTEYEVETEFCEVLYKISIEEGYVRTVNLENRNTIIAQAELTEDQLTRVKEVMNRLGNNQ